MAGELPLMGPIIVPDDRAILAPSLLSADFLAIGDAIDALCGEADWLHVDVMDGHYVPNLTFGPALVRALRKRYPDAFVDVHLMVDDPDSLLDSFIAAGPSTLTIHVEAAKHIHRTLQKIRDAGVHPGVTLNPGTPVELLYPVLHMADLVLVMSVNPGFGGQSFIRETIPKLDALVRWREVNGARYVIEMDGGLGPNNVCEVASHGCQAIVAGNAVFGAPDPAAAAREIKAQAIIL